VHQLIVSRTIFAQSVGAGDTLRPANFPFLRARGVPRRCGWRLRPSRRLRNCARRTRAPWSRDGRSRAIAYLLREVGGTIEREFLRRDKDEFPSSCLDLPRPPRPGGRAHWTWLVHRPTSHRATMAGVASAARIV
jgi:hypothetical protein